MVITVTFKDDTIKHIDNFSDVFELENKLNIKQLDCRFNQLTKLPQEIKQLVNLEVLWCSENKLTELPKEISHLINLDILFCDNNKLCKLPEEIKQLVNLRYIDCGNNQLTKLPEDIGQLVNLYDLRCSDNNLTELPQELGRLINLQRLVCGYNQLTKLPQSIGQLVYLRELYCNNNQLTELPIEIIQCRRLNDMDYENNPLTIHPLIQRFIDDVENYRNHDVYNDGQNVHNSHIQSSTRESIFNILKDTLDIDSDIMMKEIIENKSLVCQTDLIEYMNDTTLHSTLNITFKDLLLYVWNRIRKSSKLNDICIRINQEMQDSECKCFTGRMTRLVNSLISFYDDVKINISPADEISNVIKLVLEKYKKDEDKLDEIKAECRKELIGRGYTDEVIKGWTDAIEL